MLRFRFGLAAIAAALALGACDSPSGSNPPAELSVEVQGPLMLDSVAQIRVLSGTEVVPPTSYTLTTEPTDGVEPMGGGAVRFVRPGVIIIRVLNGKKTGSTKVEVGGPLALNIAVAGRVERNSVVHVSYTQASSAVLQSSVTLTASPSDAIQLLGGDSLRLLRAGNVVLTATYGRSTGTRTVAVATPPSIIFDRVVSGNRDIWRVALDGGDLTQLTTETAEDLDPTVAAGRVVFISYRADRNAELFSIPIGGGTATRITTTTTNEGVPALSPDGTRLAYTAEQNGVSKLWTATGTGANAARATTGFGFDGSIESSPSWAPTGSRLVFMSTANGTADVFDFTIPGTPSLLAGGGSSADFEPAFSPDGLYVAFGSDRSGNGGADVFLVRLSDRQITRLTTLAASEGQPTWTPDGRLVYTEFGSAGGQLRWLDPAVPGIIHSIATGTGSARNPAAVP